MATQNHTSYALSPAAAAALRVPPIYYKNGVIPGDVISKMTGCKEEDTPISEIDKLLKNRLLAEISEIDKLLKNRRRAEMN